MLTEGSFLSSDAANLRFAKPSSPEENRAAALICTAAARKETNARSRANQYRYSKQRWVQAGTGCEDEVRASGALAVASDMEAEEDDEDDDDMEEKGEKGDMADEGQEGLPRAKRTARMSSGEVREARLKCGRDLLLAARNVDIVDPVYLLQCAVYLLARAGKSDVCAKVQKALAALPTATASSTARQEGGGTSAGGGGGVVFGHESFPLFTA